MFTFALLFLSGQLIVLLNTRRLQCSPYVAYAMYEPIRIDSRPALSLTVIDLDVTVLPFIHYGF